jgi:predicted dehydrogenase
MRLFLSFLIGLCGIIPNTNCAAQAEANAHPKLRLGVVGFHHGHVLGFFRNYLNRSDIEIVGFAEPDRPLSEDYTRRYRLDPARVFSSVEELIDKAHPQAVVTYTSTFDHRAVVETCAKHGVHVMMEKPLTVSLEDALAMQKAGREGKINVLVNYETSWYRSNHAAQALLQSGAIGDLRKVVVHDGHRGPKEIGCGPEFLSWLTDPKLNGAGALFDFGCYGADLVTWLMDGQRPQTVTAVTQQIKPDIYPKVDDEATIIITYPKTQAILQASWNWPFDRKDMEVYGRTGSVFTIRNDDVRVRLPRGREETKAGKALASPYDDQISYLRGVVLDGAKVEPLSSIETNVTVVEILDAARESAKSGKTVHLPATR